MRKIYLYMAIGAMVFGNMACSEDALEPNPLERDYFLEPDGSSSAIAALQKEFYQKENIYLLFNDTLHREFIGYDGEGERCYEYDLIDMTYGMTSNLEPAQNIFRYDYLPSDGEKEKAAAFIRNKILPSLGKALRPYSFLLVNRIDYYKSNYGSLMLTNPSVYAGWRSTAVALEGVAEMTEEQQNSFKMVLLGSIASNKMAALDQAVFKDFYSFCAPYYGTYFMGEDATAFIAQHPTLYDIGLLTAYAYGNPYGYMDMCNFKAKEYDLQDYTDALFSMPEAEFRQLHADHPIVLKKYDILKKIVMDLGIIF